MAFQQPARQPVQRVARPSNAEADDVTTHARPSSERAVEESQTWVLFSPPTEVTTTSYLSESDHSLVTPGRSQLSELGSLNTVARSARHTDARQSASFSAIDDVSVEDDTELDSLDSHLPEFRSIPGAQARSHHGSPLALPVFPAHDGLGSFRLDRPVFSREAQDHIYQFERFNPRRVRRRLDSFERGHLELDYGQHQEEEKRLRIEAWRLEHSRILLDEVQRETRRRRKSQASMHRIQRAADGESDNMTWHDEDAIQTEAPPEGILARITRKVVKDFLGIDDRLLSILLGEAIPEDDELSTTPRASQLGGWEVESDSTWQVQILERLSQELGLLVSQLSHHPGAFSTYLRVQQMPLPYAGLPVIHESVDGPQTAEATEPEQHTQPSLPDFQPTVNQQSQPIAIPGRRDDESSVAKDDVPMENAFTKDEWERSLDFKLVFRYLITRFTSRSKGATPSTGPHAGTPTAQDSTAKMTRVRQHHPLIARSRPVERRAFKATMPSSPVALRHHSSCASQSTRRSARRSSCSSRHYWDIGGSLGTGSIAGPHGPMGSWGEV
ncbi:hypothetical protein JDV02_006859 [Purpureocillium takamizusanense]|uniref:Uncharacterized protein n=1 Tax=Purpureocillium takamizusanense TaxID=2060973 RepID=A0A9Q8QJJ2_9HYPO|nr:uncharacterized protein JDV02_006859 [Purpureocillium takamizusanense]UNI20805.1 hypothetical protein JDV02_006859 [Purpureocillium takamizusanense]